MNEKISTQLTQIEQSLNLNTKILEAVADLIYVNDLKKKQNVYTNKSIFEELGYCSEEILELGNEIYNSVIHPDDLESVIYRESKVFPFLKDTEKTVFNTQLFSKKEQKYLLYEYSVTVFERNEAGEVVKVIGIARNIQQQSKEEVALKHFNERILSTSPEIIYVNDIIKQQNIFTNKSIYDQLGYTSNEIKEMGNQMFETILHPEDLQIIAHGVKNVYPNLKDDEISKHCSRIYSKTENKYIWFEYTESIFERNTKGDVTKVIGVARNIHQQKVAEIELNEEMEKLIYNVSHDLRAPIRHIEYFTMLLDKENINEEERKLNLNKIKSSIGRLGSMIDQLLDHSRSRNTILNYSTVEVEKLILFLKETFEQTNPNKKIIWKILDIPNCTADKEKLKIVWENLISNAIKFSKNRAQIDIEITCSTNSDFNIYCIKDNGVGFNEKYKEKLFMVFKRLHTTKEYKGHGIGLANVKRVVNLHKGEVWAKSDNETGAQFFFSIPKNK